MRKTKLTLFIAILFVIAVISLAPVFRPDRVQNTYVLDHTVTDHGAATTEGNRSIKDLLTTIGTSQKATIKVPHAGSGNTTTYTVSTTYDASSYTNVTIEVENGAIFSVASAKTLTIGGPFEAGLYQVFSGTGTVTFGSTSGNDGVFVEWWGTDATALQAAIDAGGANIGGKVKIGKSTITVNATVTSNTEMRLVGEGWENSIIDVGASGKLEFVNAATSRRAVIENLRIQTSETGIDMVEVTSGYEIQFNRVYFSGGSKSVKIDEAVQVVFNNCRLSNDAAARYALYVDSATFVNGLVIRDTRITGMVFIDSGPSGHTLTIDGSIIEAHNNPVVNINRATNLSISGSYFEASGSAANLLDIDQNVLGGNVTGNFFAVDTNTKVHILCDGSGINFEGNFFGTIGSQDQITLESNSSYNHIGHQWDAGGGTAVPTVTDSGTHNKVWGWHEKHFWISATELASVTGNPALNTSVDGAPALELFDAIDSSVEYMFRLPDDRWVVKTYRADVLYAFNVTDAGKYAYIKEYAVGQATGAALNASNLNANTQIEAANTNLTKLTGAGDTMATTDEFVSIKIFREGTSPSDDTTSHFFIYGIDIRIQTLGY